VSVAVTGVFVVAVRSQPWPFRKRGSSREAPVRARASRTGEYTPACPSTRRLSTQPEPVGRSNRTLAVDARQSALGRAGTLRPAGYTEPLRSSRWSTRKPVLLSVSTTGALAVTCSHSQSTRNYPV